MQAMIITLTFHLFIWTMFYLLIGTPNNNTDLDHVDSCKCPEK
jgi:hypothetical protein